MAKTENLLQGRLGNLIFYQVKGVTRIRSVPLMVRNPETPAQQAVRKRLIVSVAVIDLEQENFHQAHLYCFFRSPDGGAFSASAYVCVPGNGGQKVPEV